MKITYKDLPKLPGVYFFKNGKGEVIYVGKAKNLRDRVKSYFHPAMAGLLPKTVLLVSDIKKIDHISVESEIDAFLLEAKLIKKYWPKYNILGKDDKSYPYIEITKDPVPLVKMVHIKTNFGPYPPGSDPARLLRFLRHIFPFVSQKHKEGEICLRSHLNLCPCKDLSVYPKNLRNLMDFLSGKRKSVQRNLEKEMNAYSKKQEYEKAAVIKEQLEKLAYLTAPRTNPWEYENNPNLMIDRRNLELREIERVLGISNLSKIEAYDISNTSGKLATGSQVVFVNGEPEKKFYRRYKIKTKDTPDDYAMLSEVLSRRLKSSVPLPELFVIDGGLGQLNAVASVIRHSGKRAKGTDTVILATQSEAWRRPESIRNGIQDRILGSPRMTEKDSGAAQNDITIIGLAKKHEEIYTQNGEIIRLPKNSPALHLLQRLRDEAHRFSRKYHFYLRRKKMLE